MLVKVKLFVILMCKGIYFWINEKLIYGESSAVLWVRFPRLILLAENIPLCIMWSKLFSMLFHFLNNFKSFKPLGNKTFEVKHLTESDYYICGFYHTLDLFKKSYAQNIFSHWITLCFSYTFRCMDSAIGHYTT